MKKPLIILTGPTAVGKTALSIELAKAVNGAIISADSMQVYKRMNIGTDKITKEKMQGVEHYLIDEFEPSYDFNVATFKEYAKKYIDKIYEENKIPILAGGTGFYIQAVLKDIDFTKTVEDNEYRNYLENVSKYKGNEFVHDMLRQVDEESADIIHANNLKRVIRALEFYRATGEKISVHNKIEQQKESPYNFAYFCLNDKRDNLYRRIDKRIDEMAQAGLVKEVRELVREGITKNNTSMKGLGYKEIIHYLDGEYDLDEAIYTLKRDTRHFAKRQLTWFKREKDVIWIQKDEFNYEEKKILEYIIDILKNKNII